jgi:cytochrome c oxidase assembly protein subunit 15
MSISAAASSASVRTLRYTSLSAAIFAFALVIWGGIVRINGAGMTCPDWPRCRGVWFPALDGSVVYEWTHRFGAPILTLLIVATFIAAWRARDQRPAAWKASWFSAALVVAQIIVGALTIKYINSPPSVAAHLGLGILTFVSLLVIWYAAGALNKSQAAFSSAAASTAYGRLALSASLITLGAILAAGYMSASNAGLACTGFPLCNGWGPPETLAQQIHMGHRLLAYLAFAAVVVIAFAGAKSQAPRIRTLSWTALALGVAQIGLGVATVASGLEPVLRSVHQANGALLFAALVLLAYEAYAIPAQATAPNVPTHAAPAAPQRI